MMSIPSALLSQPTPAELSFGVGGIAFFAPEDFLAAQSGYHGPDWSESWLVVARDTACGDPIFVDCAQPKLPVFTAMQGMGAWDPTPVALSWSGFIAALEAARPFTVGREQPVGVEQNPLSAVEQASLSEALERALGRSPPYFWALLFVQEEP